MTNTTSHEFSGLTLTQIIYRARTCWYSLLELSLYRNVSYVFQSIISLSICWIAFIIIRLSVLKIAIVRNHTLVKCLLFIHAKNERHGSIREHRAGQDMKVLFVGKYVFNINVYCKQNQENKTLLIRLAVTVISLFLSPVFLIANFSPQ